MSDRSRSGARAVLLRRATVPRGRVRLASLVYAPQSEPRAMVVVLSHGYTGCKETLDVSAGYLCARGWPCVTFDFSGHKLGGSNGRMDTARDAADDLEAVVSWTIGRFRPQHIALVGHSLGGLVSLDVAARLDMIAGVASLGASGVVAGGFDTPAGASLMALRGDYVEGAEPLAVLSEAGRMVDRLAGLAGRPALFVAARGDILVRPANVKALADRMGPQSEFVIVEGGHMDLPVRARGFVGSWLERVSS